MTTSFCDSEGWGIFSHTRAMDFTMCFQDSVLTVVPSASLLIFLSPRIFKVLGRGRLEGVKAGPVFYLKMLTVVAALGVQAAILAQTVSMDSYHSSLILSTVMYLLALLGATLLHYFEFFNMVNPSSGLMIFWLFTALISIFPTRSWIQESPSGLQGGGEPHSIPVLKLVFTIFSFVLFILENIPRAHRQEMKRKNSPLDSENIDQSNPSPEPYSNFFARITFFWLLPLLNLGKKKSLKMEDIYCVHPKLLSYPLYLTTKAKMDADAAIDLERIKDEAAAAAATTDGKDGKSKKTKKGKMNLISITLHTVGYGFMSAIIPRLLYIAANYVRPVLFSQLIAFVNSYSHSTLGQPQDPWIGFGLLIAVFASSVLTSLFLGQYTNICYNSSLKARGVFVSLIYRKALRLSSTNKQEGMGSIVNHMSTDVDQVVAFFNLLHISWSSVLEVAFALALLWGQVRYALFASVGVVILIIALSGACSPKIGGHMGAMMQSSDKRMKLISELVSSIKSIKLYAWEPYFLKKILDIRILQLDNLRKFYIWIGFVGTFLNSVAPFAIFATLSVYTAIEGAADKGGKPLDIQRIFTAIALINMLEGPVMALNGALSSIASGIVSYRRLREFLNSEEVDDENVIRGTDFSASEFAYEIRDGTFGWYTPEAIQATLDKKEKEALEKSKAEAKAAKKNKGTKAGDEIPLSDIKGEKADLETSSNSSSAAISSTTDLDGVDTQPEAGEASPSKTSDSFGPVLHDIQLKIRHGALTAVVGRVGEGKSSLVGALLGEMHRYSGSVHAYGSVAYVAQSAWILNDTVRNNILFGKPYDQERYLKTIRACALVPDFKMLVNSDMTVIGEKGINLSGGQKQRISIARAVYSDADVYILDDPLSAVDAHVDHHIFQEALCSILANKTRVLVTNGVSHLHDVDQIVVIKAGRISQDGAYTDLIQNVEGDLYRLIQESKVVAATKAKDGEAKNKDAETESTSSEDEQSVEIETKDAQTLDTPKDEKRPTMRRAKSSKIKEEEIDLKDADEVDDEIESTGRVGWEVYKFFLSTLGFFSLVCLVSICLCYLAFNIMTLIWLQNWGDDNQLASAYGIATKHSTQYWLLTYFGWVLAAALMLGASCFYTLVYMARKAAKSLHFKMLAAMIRAPMSFFDVTSSGKIVNRFAHDITSIDIQLPVQLLNFLLIVMMAINIFVFCVMATPYFLIAMIPIGYGYYWLGGFFLVSSREIKRLDSAARSPLYAHFGETLSGLVTIRAYHDSDRFAIQATKLLDRSQQTSYLTNATTRWLQIMIDFLSTLVLCIVALLAIVQRQSIQAPMFSTVLSQINNLTSIMSSLLSIICVIETAIVSVERIREYSMLTPEARDVIPDSKTPEAWPQNGQVVLSDYSTRYREGLDLVLKNIDVTIQGGSRVGIVGRTGAGKSSVTLALFRIIEAASGSISIDGIDISTLGLTELRSRLTIIPQDPFLFGDSIRTNLDPFGKCTDAEIWSALDSASLKTYVLTLADGLSAMIENGGENMSLGQRQLMSLARAMLSKNTRVLCLDEATAAIDVETDNAIQRALRREFQNCTVLTIAHRINTIMDSDKILVLDHGRVAEFDTPEALLQNKDSIFFSLASKSGNA